MVELESMDALSLPKRIISMDKGSVQRTEYLAYETLIHPLNGGQPVEIVYMDKSRKEAGEVDHAEVVRVVRWTITPEGKIEKTELQIPTLEDPYLDNCSIIGGDDIFDTGRTFETDLEVVLSLHPNAKKKVFSATHPVLSKGIDVLDRLPVDVFLFGNTLHTNGLSNHEKVRMVDMAPALSRTLEGKNFPAYSI